MGESPTEAPMDDLIRLTDLATPPSFDRRFLTAEDVEVLKEGAEVGSIPPPLTRLRHTHHELAKLLADGVRPKECMAITGYSQSRISILQNDPAFAELVEHYAKTKAEIYRDVHARLAALGMDVVETLQERLDEAPETFSKKELMDLMEKTLDRSSAPPKRRGDELGAGAVIPAIQINFVQPGADHTTKTIDAPAAPILVHTERDDEIA